ncbi:PROTON GRADIENT REGULATION 5, chloroplastic [Olea europaea subsp. europaea]|uniref:PROTON GRADIENT REGULATION 5, chloroplastic n=1 Tax=Olea europaea subsp. europaea TaxID=158383 RepID=A0A8S0SCM0_OLEEU|nr:PROTON GRADIENT REGULATION 5, chloroplastic [Olea europaea subsp. europaea]
MAATVYATGFKDGLGLSSSSFMAGEDYAALARAVPTQVRMAHPVRSRPMMKNVNEGKGLFAPIVVVTRNVIGKKTFNQLRGKAIALHSQRWGTVVGVVVEVVVTMCESVIFGSGDCGGGGDNCDGDGGDGGYGRRLVAVAVMVGLRIF